MKFPIASLVLVILAGCGNITTSSIAGPDAQAPDTSHADVSVDVSHMDTNSVDTTFADTKPGTTSDASTVDGSAVDQTMADRSAASETATEAPPSDVRHDPISLKIVPSQVVFVIGNNNVLQARYGYGVWYYPIGFTCKNPSGNTAMIWRDNKWQMTAQPVQIERIATSQDLLDAKVDMGKNDLSPDYPPLSIDTWMMQHQATLEADATKVNASASTPLECAR